MPPNLKNAYKAAIAAGALGAGLATPDDANATLVSALRQEIQNLLKQGWKQYYHYSYNPEVTMQGISDPMLYKAQKEGWKPWAGLYAADNLRKIPGHVSGSYYDTSSLLREPSGMRSRISRMIGNHPHEQGTKGDQPIIRVLVPPDARTRSIFERDMHSYNTELKEMERLRRVEQGEIPPNMPVSLSPRTLSQHWSDVADVLQIKDVDAQPGLSEYLLMNPDKPKMFWENMSWDAYNGPQTHGPMTERTFGGVGRGRGQSRQELGLGVKNPVQPSGSSTIGQIARDPAALKNFLNSAEQWFGPAKDPPTPENITLGNQIIQITGLPLSENFNLHGIVNGGLNQKIETLAQVLGLIPRPQKSSPSFNIAKQPDWMQHQLASRITVDTLGAGNAPASLANLSRIPAGALAAALGVGGLVSSPNEAEAGPRADALRKALRGDLFHGTPNLPEVVEKGLQQGKKYDSQKAVYLSDHPSYASQYAADPNEFGFRDGAGVYMARLDPSTRVKVQKGNTYFVTEAEAEALRKKGYDAVTTFPEPQRAGQAGLGGGLGHGEIAVINPEKILPKYGKGAIAAALGLGSLNGVDDAEAMPIDRQTRKAILTMMATTPERKALLKKAAPAIEQAVSLPGVRRAYVGGSFASNKPNPGDIDLVLRHEPMDDVHHDNIFGQNAESLKKRKVDIGMATDSLNYSDEYDPKGWMEEARRRYGKDYKWTRILGVGALAAGGVLSSEPSDAFPIGKLGKLNPKILSHPRNEEALDALLGHVLRGTDEVVDVRRHPKNDWRYVITKTAEGKHQQLPMTKDYLNVYAGARGTQKYERKFEQQGYQGKKVQALKSLNIREEKRANTSHVKDKDFRAWNTAQMEKAREIDPSLVNDYVYVHVLDDAGGNTKGQSLYVPKRYAEFLAQKGYVKILKR